MGLKPQTPLAKWGARALDFGERLPRHRCASEVRAEGSFYRACWCAKGFMCDLASDYVVDAGTMVLIGPHFNQHKTCVTGALCQVSGITGVGLQDGNGGRAGGRSWFRLWNGATGGVESKRSEVSSFIGQQSLAATRS